jgi:hypothetical protein
MYFIVNNDNAIALKYFVLRASAVLAVSKSVQFSEDQNMYQFIVILMLF